MHLGSLESTQEARVALSNASSNASFVLSQLPVYPSITRCKNEPIRLRGMVLAYFSPYNRSSGPYCSKTLSSGEVAMQRIKCIGWSTFYPLGSDLSTG